MITTISPAATAAAPTLNLKICGPDKATSHPFFPHLRIQRTNSGAILLSAAVRELLPSPRDRIEILDFLGFDDATADEILRSYDCGTTLGLRLDGDETRRYPLLSAMVGTWAASHTWVAAYEPVEFARRNGLRERFARDIDWPAEGAGWVETVVRYQKRNVELLKGLLVQAEQDRVDRLMRSRR